MPIKHRCNKIFHFYNVKLVFKLCLEVQLSLNVFYKVGNLVKRNKGLFSHKLMFISISIIWGGWKRCGKTVYDLRIIMLAEKL